MTKLPAGIIICAALIALAGCASKAETIGTLGGAAVGNAATGGSGLGTAAWGVIGYAVGKTYQQKNRLTASTRGPPVGVRLLPARPPGARPPKPPTGDAP